MIRRDSSSFHRRIQNDSFKKRYPHPFGYSSGQALTLSLWRAREEFLRLSPPNPLF
jgi:hypothetical protein